MVEGPNAKSLTKKLVPRFLKATIWGTLTYFLVYYLPMQIIPLETLPFDYSSQLTSKLLQFAAIAVFFTVINQLLSGTVFGYAFGIAKAFVIIAYFVYVSNGGVISLAVPLSEATVNLVVILESSC